MPRITFDPDNVSGSSDFKPLEPGEYTLYLDKWEWKTSKNGHEQLSLTYLGPNNRFVYNLITFGPESMSYVNAFLLSCGRPVKPGEVDVDDRFMQSLHGKSVRAMVKAVVTDPVSKKTINKIDHYLLPENKPTTKTSTSQHLGDAPDGDVPF